MDYNATVFLSLHDPLRTLILTQNFAPGAIFYMQIGDSICCLMPTGTLARPKRVVSKATTWAKRDPARFVRATDEKFPRLWLQTYHVVVGTVSNQRISVNEVLVPHPLTAQWRDNKVV